MNIVYKASALAKAERKYQMKFFDAMSNIGGFSEIMFFLEAGGVSEEEADAFIAEKGITEAMAAIMEAISKSGFLGEMEINMEEFRQEMAKNTKQAVSQNTGKVNKS